MPNSLQATSEVSLPIQKTCTQLTVDWLVITEQFFDRAGNENAEMVVHTPAPFSCAVALYSKNGSDTKLLLLFGSGKGCLQVYKDNAATRECVVTHGNG